MSNYVSKLRIVCETSQVQSEQDKHQHVSKIRLRLQNDIHDANKLLELREGLQDCRSKSSHVVNSLRMIVNESKA